MNTVYDIIFLSNNAESWQSFMFDFSKSSTVYLKFNPICYQSIEQFEKKYDEWLNQEQFRIWIHLGKKGNKIGFEGESLSDDLKSHKDYKNFSFQYITRSTEEALNDLNGVPIYSTRDLRSLDFSTISINNNEISQNNKSIAIITALPEEFKEVETLFNLKSDPSMKLGDKNVFTGLFNDFNIIAIYQNTTGNVDASSLTTEVIKEYKPKYVVMTGVCGGSDKTSLGDVMIAKIIFTLNKGKIEDQGFFRELEIVKINEGLLRIISENDEKIIKTMKKDHMDNELAQARFKEFDLNKIRHMIEPMACSTSVINKVNYFRDVIKKVDRKTSAVEMESYGVARAAENIDNGKTKCLVIKSVMDNTVHKTDEAKPYASYTSALFLKSLLQLNVLP